MTKNQHKNIISTIFFVIGSLSIFAWVSIGGWYLGEWMFLVYSLLYLIAGWKIHNDTPGAAIFGIVASIISVPNFPIGTLIGIYGLWYFILAKKRTFDQK